MSRELQPFEAPFFSIDDLIFVAKTSTFKTFWLTAIKVRPGVYEKSEKQRIFISS